jgi:hypothetical protein
MWLLTFIEDFALIIILVIALLAIFVKWIWGVIFGKTFTIGNFPLPKWLGGFAARRQT